MDYIVSGSPPNVAIAVVPHYLSGAVVLPGTKLVDSAGNPVSWGFTPIVITTKTTTLVKSGAGMVGSIQTSLLGTADTLTVYDALTATGTPILELVTPALGTRWLEGAVFAIGLCIVTGGTTAGKYNVLFA